MDKEERDQARHRLDDHEEDNNYSDICVYLEKALDEIGRLEEILEGKEAPADMFHTMTTTTTEYKEPKLCPVCGGKGKVCIKLLSLPPQDKWLLCHGCAGKGWVTV